MLGGDLVQEPGAGGGALHARRSDQHGKQESKGVGDDVPLPAVILSHRDEDGLDQGRCDVDSVLDAGCWGLLRLRKVPRLACRSLLMVSWTMSRLSL